MQFYRGKAALQGHARKCKNYLSTSEVQLLDYRKWKIELAATHVVSGVIRLPVWVFIGQHC